MGNSQFERVLWVPNIPTTSIHNYSVSTALIVLWSFGGLGRLLWVVKSGRSGNERQIRSDRRKAGRKGSEKGSSVIRYNNYCYKHFKWENKVCLVFYLKMRTSGIQSTLLSHPLNARAPKTSIIKSYPDLVLLYKCMECSKPLSIAIGLLVG